jgi:hypothetical protein
MRIVRRVIIGGETAASLQTLRQLMSIHISENEFRDFLRRFLIVERDHRGVTIRINQIDAERYLGKDKQATEHIMNDASEFICLIAD